MVLGDGAVTSRHSELILLMDLLTTDLNNPGCSWTNAPAPTLASGAWPTTAD